MNVLLTLVLGQPLLELLYFQDFLAKFQTFVCPVLRSGSMPGEI
jgi:hypothetical protein